MTEWKVGPREADNEKLGELLLELRTKAGFSRTTAAHRLDLSSEYLRLIERGVRTPVEGNMRSILDLYRATYTVELGRIVIGDVSVEFTSRIKEPRRKAYIEEEVPVPATMSRSTRIGRIVELLISAENEDLRQVHVHLTRSREKHGQ